MAAVAARQGLAAPLAKCAHATDLPAALKLAAGLRRLSRRGFSRPA